MSDQIVLDYTEDDLRPTEIIVSLGTRKFVLRSANGDAAIKYKNALIKRVTFGSEGNAQKVDGLADVEPLLLVWCMRECVLDAEGEPKPGEFIKMSPNLDDVRSWPPKVITAYHTKITEISEMDEEDDTIESLTQQKEAIKKKLAKLEADGDPAKND